jgi:hypothetical protein
MAATAPTIDSSPPPTVPSISISISTGTPTFDLCLENPVAIIATLTLHYSQPIPFRKRWAPFFANPLDDPGLIFKNIRTGEQQIGMKVTVCYLISYGDELPTEANRDD